MSKIRRELRNYYAVIADLATRSEEWSAKPAWLEFAPNNVCNLRCIMCAQADGLPVEVMKTEDAVELLDEILPDMSVWTPSALSEPMLANIKMVVQKCREHEVYLNMYSNATLLNGEKFADMADRIHKLWISFDSPRREVLEMLRDRADFDQVVANMREVIQVAIAKQVPVGFVAVLVKDNLEHLDELVDFLADLGAVESRSDLRIQPMLDNAERCRDQNVFSAYTEEQIVEHIDRACERARERGMIFHVDMDEPFRRNVVTQAPMVREISPEILSVMLDEVKERFPHFCSMATNYVKIEPNGEVYPCCRGPRELLMGNVNDQSMTEIWNGAKYREFRRRMNAKDYPDVCSTCDVLVANPHFDKAWVKKPAVNPSDP
ncbi:MAG: SPASM domain-containing protein [bacterium]|nr:SPASM domain-containing protein [bacterium]